MEHEKVIQQKVLAADNMVVSWRKDRVWNQLQQVPERKRSDMLPYALAAGFALIAVIGYVVQSRIQQQTNEQIAQLELAIQKSESARTLPPIVESKVCEQNAPTMLVNRQSKKDPVPMTVDQTPVANEHVAVIEPVQKIETPADPTVNVEAEAIEPRVIQAIVGRIPEQAAPVAVGKRKKVLLFPTEKIDKSIAATSNGAILTARIN